MPQNKLLNWLTTIELHFEAKLDYSPGKLDIIFDNLSFQTLEKYTYVSGSF